MQLNHSIQSEPYLPEFSFYEFFAGGGMARAGFGERWACLFANDIDSKKAESYRDNWSDEEFVLSDIHDVEVDQLPGQADLVWASFPCQDLSLAGARAGLSGGRSSTFWRFIGLVQELGKQERQPELIVIENVPGVLTSNGGEDFAAIGKALVAAGYRYGALLMDAVHFIPQSRPRIFIVGVKKDAVLPDGLVRNSSEEFWHSAAICKAFEGLSNELRENWLWWDLPQPARRNAVLKDIIEERPIGVAWNEAQYTEKLLSMMSDVNMKKVRDAQAAGERRVGTVYRRTRNGKQMAEVRFDGIAGCLRTPAGGSSRQTILVIDGKDIRSRLLSPREAARLMGLPDEYILPTNYNTAYHLAGDGVAAPVVRHLAEHVLEPALANKLP